MGKVLFVSGGHGVGKTFFCNYLVEKYRFVHHAASKLISQKKEVVFSNSKRIEGISENQSILIEAIKDLRLEREVLLLDGHFCLINLESKVVRLPTETFESLSPVGIILLIDSAENIQSRLKRRDGVTALDKELISLLQTEEIGYGTEIAKKLQVPLFIHSISESKEEVDNFIQSLELEK